MLKIIKNPGRFLFRPTGKVRALTRLHPWRHPNIQSLKRSLRKAAADFPGDVLSNPIDKWPQTLKDCVRGYRVRVLVTPCGFRGGQNGDWICFSQGFFRCPLSQIFYRHLRTVISLISSATVMVRQPLAGILAIHRSSLQ